MRPLADLLRALLAIPGAFLALLRRLWRLLLALLHRDEHPPGRRHKAARTRCVPIDDPAMRVPDPLVYSQDDLRARGLPVTWDNPDFTILDGSTPVGAHQLQPDHTYTVEVRIWNAVTDCPVVAMPVHLSFLDFGMGAVSVPVGTRLVDVGVLGGPNNPSRAAFTWHTPATPGHYCLQAQLDPASDRNTQNNLGQHNTDVVEAHSPGVFAFTLRNETRREHDYTFDVDAYVLHTPGCERPGEVPRRPRRARRRHAPATRLDGRPRAAPPPPRAGRPRVRHRHRHPAERLHRQPAGQHPRPLHRGPRTRPRRWGQRRRRQGAVSAMAGFKQYTLCSQPSQWMSPAAYIALATAAIAVVFAGIGWATFPCGLLLIEAFAIAGSIAFCDWWLNVRLVCLGGDESVVGMVVSAETPAGRIRLRRPRHRLLDQPPRLPDDAGGRPARARGERALRPPRRRDRRRADDHVGFFRGEFAQDEKRTLPKSAILHAEFEGAGYARLPDRAARRVRARARRLGPVRRAAASLRLDRRRHPRAARPPRGAHRRAGRPRRHPPPRAT